VVTAALQRPALPSCSCGHYYLTSDELIVCTETGGCVGARRSGGRREVACDAGLAATGGNR